MSHVEYPLSGAKPQDWSYAATCARRVLETAIRNKQVTGGQIPERLYNSMQRLFDLSQENLGQNSYINNHVFRLFVEIMARSDQPVRFYTEAELQQTKETISAFKQLIEKIQHSPEAKLQDTDLKTASSLDAFLSQIIKEANEADYSQAMGVPNA